MSRRSYRAGHKTSFNLTFRYIDDVLPTFNDYIDVIYPEEREIKDTTYATNWANYLDLSLSGV